MSRKYVRLTKEAINAAAPGTTIRENGIIAEKLPDGDVRFSVGIMVDGVRIHRVLGLRSEKATRQQAETMIETLRTRAREDRLDLPKGRKTRMGFAEAAGKYIELQRSVGDGLVERKRSTLEKRLVPHMRGLPVSGVTTDAIEAYIAGRLSEGAAPGTINRELSTLSHLLRKAREWRWIAKDAAPKVRKLKEGPGRVIALTDDESTRLVLAARCDLDPDVWIFVLLGLETSMRHGELRRARWEHLDAEHRRLHIPLAKAGMRDQPLSTRAVAMLVAERERRKVIFGPIFPPGAGSRTDHRHTFRKAFRRCVEAAGLDPNVVTPHVMRHTAITRFVKARIDLPTVQKLSGHKTMSQVLRYAHVHSSHIDEAADLGSLEIAPGTENRS